MKVLTVAFTTDEFFEFFVYPSAGDHVQIVLELFSIPDLQDTKLEQGNDDKRPEQGINDIVQARAPTEVAQ